MEFQGLKAADNRAIRDLYLNPFADVYCPRCGNRMIFIVRASFEELGNIYEIRCSSTPRCFFYPIPPTITPECIRWHHPDEIKTGAVKATYSCSTCCATTRCAVDRDDKPLQSRSSSL